MPPVIDPFKATALPNNGGLQKPPNAPSYGKVPESTYHGPISDAINNTQQGADLVNADKEQAAKMGITIPGSTYKPPTTATTPPATTTSDSSSSTTSPSLADQTDRDALKQAQEEYQSAADNVRTTIDNIRNGVTPLTPGEQAQIDGLKQQFQQLIDQQTLQNTGAQGTANMRGYQKGAAEYDPTFQMKTIGSIVSAGIAKVSDLQIKEASAVAALTQGFKDNDIAAIKDSWDIYKDASTKRQEALQKTIDDTATAIKDAQDAKIAADKVQYDQVTKPLQDVQTTLAKSGAPKEVIAAAGNAKTVEEALAAGGNYLQTSTNPDISSYLFYKQQAEAAGQTASSFADFQDQQSKRENAQAYAKAYQTAAGSAAGKASVDGLPDPVSLETPAGLGSTAGGGSILSATGLSIAAFNFLTQGTPSMSRMTAGQRIQIMGEAQKWLNKNGVDISTFQSQYDAYNTVLQKNIQRANQTKIMAGEVSGSADALIQAIDSQGGLRKPNAFLQGVADATGGQLGPVGHSGGTNLRPAILLDLMAGKQVNDPFVMQYRTQLGFMANDLAGYLAASRGATSPELQDQRDAASIISDGLSKGSTQAFKQAIESNESKVATVVNKSVDSTRKQVWDLFGVGQKYVGGNSAGDQLIVDDQKAQSALVKFYDASPENAQRIDELSKIAPDATAAEIAQKLGIPL